MPLDESKIEKLGRLVDILDPANSLTRADFNKSLEQVLKLLLAMEKRNQEAIVQLQQGYNRIITELDSGHKERFKELKLNVNDLFVGERLKEIENKNHMTREEMRKHITGLINFKIKEIDERMSRVKDGERGLQGPAGSPDTPMMVKNKLLAAGLELDSVKGLKEELDKIQKSIRRTPGRVLAGPSATSIQAHYFRSDGSKSYRVPLHSEAIALLSTGPVFMMKRTTDWTTANTTLTITGAVEDVDGQEYLLLYRK